MSVYGKKIWTDAYAQGVPRHIDYQDILIPQYLEQSVKAFPDNPALIFQGYTLTFTQLNDMVCRFAAALKDFNINKGDKVAILLPNVIPCVVAYYATLKIGGIVVFNNPLYTDRELEHQFTDSGASFLITLDLLADRMVKLRKKTDITTIVYTSIGDYLPFVKRLLFPLVAKKRGLAKMSPLRPTCINSRISLPNTPRTQVRPVSPWTMWPCTSIPAAPQAFPRA